MFFGNEIDNKNLFLDLSASHFNSCISF